MMNYTKILLALLITTAGYEANATESAAHAEETSANVKEVIEQKKEKDPEGVFSLSVENDSLLNNDSNYTSGVRLSYISPEKVPYWLEKTANLLPLLSTDGNKRWGFAAGQSIFTPNDISLQNPPLTDRPYAGWLYGTATLISDNTTTLDTFQITLGMVGPSSLAEQSQDFVHQSRDIQQPQGWDYQLKDEPGIIVSYDRKWRDLYQTTPFGLGFDITPSAGANLGNVDTSANVGLMARLGQDLPSDYGPPLIKPSVSGSDFFEPTKDFGWYFFAGVTGKAVARDIFLDGNTFNNSRSVDKEILVGGVQGGLVLTFDKVRIAYTQVHKTDEYKTQTEATEYSAINVSYRF
jgi:lipid A 3-O-deacylase